MNRLKKAINDEIIEMLVIKKRNNLVCKNKIKISKNLFEILKNKFKINGRYNLNEKFLNESKLIQEIFMENGDSIEIMPSTLKFRISKKMSRFYYCLNERKKLDKMKTSQKYYFTFKFQTDENTAYGNKEVGKLSSRFQI